MTQASSAHADAPKATDQLTLADVRAAAARIAGAVVRTPMLRSQTLSDIAGADIWLKFENHQFTAAYKERGALNALLQLSDEQRARGVIAASAGNHSQGLSYHGRRLGQYDGNGSRRDHRGDGKPCRGASRTHARFAGPVGGLRRCR